MASYARSGPSNGQRRRPFNNPHRAPARPPTQEDAQPNELLGKNNIPGPPVVRASAPLSRNPIRGDRGSFRASNSFFPRRRGPSTRMSNHRDNMPAAPSGSTLLGSAELSPRLETALNEFQDTRKHNIDDSLDPVKRRFAAERPRPQKLQGKRLVMPDTEGDMQHTRSSFPSSVELPSRKRHKSGSARFQIIPNPHITSDIATASHYHSLQSKETAKNQHHQEMPPTPFSNFTAAVASTSGSPAIKRERSPTPLLDSFPHLINSGCVCIRPLPPNCRSIHPGYKDARKMLAAKEMKKLRMIGLQTTRWFAREDGLVIDWKSSVPVMSDTLRPPPKENIAMFVETDGEASVSPNPEAADSTPSCDGTWTGPAQADNLMPSTSQVLEYSEVSIAAADPFGECVNITAISQPSTRSIPRRRHRLSVPAIGTSSSDPSLPPLHVPDDVGQMLSISADIPAPPISRSPLPDESPTDELTTAVLGFLERYLLTYIEDRSALAPAYSRVATFSVQTHPDPSFTMSITSTPNSTTPILRPPKQHQGRAEIIAALLELSDGRRLYSSAEGEDDPAGEVQWDFVDLQESGDVLLICYAVDTRRADQPVSGKGKGRATDCTEKWSCDQRFVLRRREWDAEDGSTPGLWSFVAVSHQMTFRPLP